MTWEQLVEFVRQGVNKTGGWLVDPGGPGDTGGGVLFSGTTTLRDVGYDGDEQVLRCVFSGGVTMYLPRALIHEIHETERVDEVDVYLAGGESGLMRLGLSFRDAD